MTEDQDGLRLVDCPLSIEAVSGWERQLVEDCRQIVFEAKLGIFKKWYELGMRLKVDEEFLAKKYGDRWYVSFSEEIEVSYQSVYRAVQFARKYPEWKDVEDFLTREKISWRRFVLDFLPNARNELPSVTSVPIPEGVFAVILADPPWDYDFSLSDRGNPKAHYATMTDEELCALTIPSADDSILYLWATNPKVEDALKVMGSWGFEYRTNLCWIKDKFGTGYYVRGQHELLLIGEKGGMPVPEAKDRPSSVLNAPRRAHSQKPNEVYDLIEKMYPNRQPYLELFARPNVRRRGWVYWGSDDGV